MTMPRAMRGRSARRHSPMAFPSILPPSALLRPTGPRGARGRSASGSNPCCLGIAPFVPAHAGGATLDRRGGVESECYEISKEINNS